MGKVGVWNGLLFTPISLRRIRLKTVIVITETKKEMRRKYFVSMALFFDGLKSCGQYLENNLKSARIGQVRNFLRICIQSSS